MTGWSAERLGDELMALLGEEGFVAFTQKFGGRRLYIPYALPDDHDIVQTVGDAAAANLSKRMAPIVIRVPLARDQRARHYRGMGRSNGEIASLLGITETAVDKLFRRMDNAPVKGSALQLSLFPDA